MSGGLLRDGSPQLSTTALEAPTGPSSQSLFEKTARLSRRLSPNLRGAFSPAPRVLPHKPADAGGQPKASEPGWAAVVPRAGDDPRTDAPVQLLPSVIASPPPSAPDKCMVCGSEDESGIAVIHLPELSQSASRSSGPRPGAGVIE
eukprot:7387156-Prymnesium_polylepis.1